MAIQSRRVRPITAILGLTAVVASGTPTFAGEPQAPTSYELKADEPEPVLVGLLLPAVQKVREAAARMKSVSSPFDRLKSADEEPILIGLLLPAVQKVRDAAADARFVPDVVIDRADGTIIEGELVGVDEFGITVKDQYGSIAYILIV